MSEAFDRKTTSETAAALRSQPTSLLIAMLSREEVVLAYALGDSWEREVEAIPVGDRAAILSEFVGPLIKLVCKEIDRRFPVKP